MNWIDKLNDRMEKSRLNKKQAGLTSSKLNQMQGRWEGGISNKGIKHSDETKKMWSVSKIGSKRNIESVNKSIIGSKETKWNQLLKKYPLNVIKKAQLKCNNHQNNTLLELGISFNSYKKLCKHYNIEKKQSNIEKSTFAKTKQSEPILVWKVGIKGLKIGKPKIYYSVSECVRQLNLHKPNMLRNMKNGTEYRGFIFEKK